MRILFLGDYSNLHTTLAGEMRRRGHDVTLVSDLCNHMNLDCDIPLIRGEGYLNAARYLTRVFTLMPRLKGYDVVQIVNPHFLHLRPGKLQYFLNRLRRQNGSLFLSLAGDDSIFVERCLDGKTFRFSEYRIGDQPTEYALRHREMERGYMLPEVRDYTRRLYDSLDGAMAVLPEYHIAAVPLLGERLCFTNLPVNLTELPYTPIDPGRKVRLLVGQRSGYELSKGTDILLEMAKQIERENPERVEAVNVRDLPWSEYKTILAGSHINLDQLYSYSPAMNALSSMALGRIAASGAEPEFYAMTGETELRPIIALSPLREDTKEEILKLIADPARMASMGETSRRFVERHNALEKVADRYEKHWIRILEQR